MGFVVGVFFCLFVLVFVSSFLFLNCQVLSHKATLIFISTMTRHDGSYAIMTSPSAEVRSYELLQLFHQFGEIGKRRYSLSQFANH